MLPTKPIKMEPEIQIQEGSEPLKFPNEDLPEDGAKKAKVEIGSKEVVVHKDFNELKKKVTPAPQPHIEIIGKQKLQKLVKIYETMFLFVFLSFHKNFS